MRQDRGQVYRRGALVLAPILVIAVFVASRAIRHRGDAKAQRAEIDRAVELDEEWKQQQKRAILDERMRQRAARAPRVANDAKPEIMARDQPWPLALAVDEAAVYFSTVDKDEIRRLDKRSRAVSVLARDQPLRLPRHARTIALSDSHVYWVTSGSREQGYIDGTVARVAKAGGLVETVAEDQYRPNALRVTNEAVFWVTSAPPKRKGTDDAPLPGGLMRAPLRADKVGQVERIREAQRPCGLALDADEIFWVEQEPTPSVMRMPRRGGEASAVIKSAGRVGCSLAVNDAALFWINPSIDGLMRARRDGTDIRTIAYQSSRLSGLLRHQGAIFSLSTRTPGAFGELGTVWRTPAMGDAGPAALAVDVRDANGIAVDAQHVYWTRWSEEDGEGVIERVAR